MIFYKSSKDTLFTGILYGQRHKKNEGVSKWDTPSLVKVLSLKSYVLSPKS